MFKTQRFIVACLVLLGGLGLGILIAAPLNFREPVVVPVPSVGLTGGVEQAVMRFIIDDFAKDTPVNGLTPYLLLEKFPNLEESDFNQAEAVVGGYEFDGALLKYTGVIEDNTTVADMTDKGFAIFLANFITRVGLKEDLLNPESILEAMRLPSENNQQQQNATTTDEFVACTMDAKQCSDGSYVGRTGPDCAFAACPAQATTTIACTPEENQAEVCAEIYQPVCAPVQIQCITTPCEPIPKTFSNSCDACRQSHVTEYTQGECAP